MANAAQTADPYGTHRATARAKWKRVTPWRLGVAVGEAGEDLPPPYTKREQRLQYDRGKADGRRWARMERQRELNAALPKASDQ